MRGRQIHALQRPRVGGLEADVQVEQRAALFGPPREIVVEVHTGKLAAQVNLVPLAVGRVVQHGVHVGEDVLVGDGVVVVLLPELPQPPLR